MVVIERFRREGDALVYHVTVEDPVMFLEPWKMDARRIQLNKNPGAQLMQDVPYNDKSLGNLTDPNYRG
jgi:alpha-D-ribose 1-methylphosphonate 5-phosphate C-P lyase